MRELAVDPEGLANAGGNMSKIDTKSATKGFLDSVTDAGGTVHHAALRGALDTFHGRWSTPANRLAYNVDAAGSQIKSSAVVSVQGDADAAAEVKPAEAGADSHAPAVSKSINF